MVVMGHVSAPFGIKGWVKVHPYSGAKENLLGYPVWWLGKQGGWREFKVLESGVHGKTVIARLEGYADRSAALRLKGLQVAMPRSRLPRCAKDEFYQADLIGLEVVNLHNKNLGEVTGILETGANDVLKVKGKGESLIPFIAQVIVKVDLAKHRILVDWTDAV